ncbi:MAG: ROK family protein [Elusimicrobiota bacterium]|jgi:glucokinase|nr:ROK family protein [Elusimicrobiota bacterium]
MEYFLGVDMGGIGVKLAVVDKQCSIIAETSFPTDIKKEPEEIIKRIAKEAESLKNYDKVNFIGLGSAGDIDSQKGVLRYAYNLPKWKKIPIKSLLQKYSKREVFIDNDANTASIGAFYLDAKAKVNNLVCVTLGTGIGGGLILNGKLYRGSSFSAGEIGHITIKYDGNPCNCGNIGCAEAYLGAKNLNKYSADFVKKHKSKIIDSLTGKDYLKISPKILRDAAFKKDKTALEIWNYAGDKLGILLSSILNIVNPDMIVLCGGLSQASKFLIPKMKEAVKKRAWKTSQKVCKITFSKYTDKLGVTGAAMLVMQQ